MNYEELSDWCDSARRSLRREMERLQEQQQTLGNHMQVLEAAGDLLTVITHQKEDLERQQREIDELNEQLEQKEQEIADLQQRHESELADLQRQLLEAKNQHLEAERQHLEAEVHSKPLEIHNHFEPGSSSQVFNDRVNGKFTRKQNDKKKNKPKWKRIVRKML